IEISYADPYFPSTAVRKEDNSVEDTTQQIVRKERRYGEYVRRFYVQNIAEDQIAASLKDGVLKLEIPKQPDSGKKRIQIRDDI
ncbi:Hsp20 family protein, partial [Clostridium perfringens]